MSPPTQSSPIYFTGFPPAIRDIRAARPPASTASDGRIGAACPAFTGHPAAIFSREPVVSARFSSYSPPTALAAVSAAVMHSSSDTASGGRHHRRLGATRLLPYPSIDDRRLCSLTSEPNPVRATPAVHPASRDLDDGSSGGRSQETSASQGGDDATGASSRSDGFDSHPPWVTESPALSNGFTHYLTGRRPLSYL